MGNTPDNEEILEKFGRWMKLRRGNSDSTVRNGQAFINRFFKWLKKNNLDVDDMNQEIVDDYLMYCRGYYSRNSMVPITTNLRKFCQFMENDIEVKVAQAKAADIDKRPLNKEEAEKMFEAAKGNIREYVILQILFYSGMRKSELVNLDVDDVRFDRRQIVIRHGKGDLRRCVNVTTDCMLAIKRWLQVRPKPKPGHEKALLLSYDNERIKGHYVWRVVKRNAAKAGVKKNVFPHKFRITNLTALAEGGLSPREIQAQSGHKDIGTLMRYLEHSPERIRESYDRVFENNNATRTNTDINSEAAPHISDEEWKKIATQKYLSGEIDSETLKTILNTIEDDDNKKTVPNAPSYQ